MGVDYSTQQERLAWELSPRAHWLDSPYGPLFCWYHRERDVTRDCAMLLCDCIGSDRMNLHLTYRHLALQLSYTGFPVLRIDYPGTGDSSGSPHDPGQVDAWISALRIGADYLKDQSGLDKIAVFGARLGGTLAATFAARNEDVTDLILWGPYLQGGEFIRDARAINRLTPSNKSGVTPGFWKEGDMESLGYYFSAETVGDLKKLDLLEADSKVCDQACIFPWDTRSREAEYVDRLEISGSRVEYHSKPLVKGADSVEFQVVPHAILDQVTNWLSSIHGTAAKNAGKIDPVTQSRATIPVKSGDSGYVVEEAIRFGVRQSLFGILSKPALPGQEKSRFAIILVNGGNNHRVGINRNYTEWARMWAGSGIAVLRMDIHGLGDSPPQTDTDLNVLYRGESANDVTAAIDWLEREHGYGEVVLCGLCAGAYQSLHAGIHDQRIRGLLLLELRRFYEHEKIYANSLQGRVKRKYDKFVLAIRTLRRRKKASLSNWIVDFCSRDVEVLVVYSAGEWIYSKFEDELFPRKNEIESTGLMTIEIIDDSDHIFSPLVSQQRLTAVLKDYVLRICCDYSCAKH